MAKRFVDVEDSAAYAALSPDGKRMLDLIRAASANGAPSGSRSSPAGSSTSNSRRNGGALERPRQKTSTARVRSSTSQRPPSKPNAATKQ